MHDPRLIDNILNRLAGARLVVDGNEVVGILAMPDFGQNAVAPHSERCACGMGVRAELLFPVAQLALLHLDDDVRHSGPVGIEHDDIGSLGTVAAKGDRVFNRDARSGIAVLVDQARQP